MNIIFWSFDRSRRQSIHTYKIARIEIKSGMNFLKTLDDFIKESTLILKQPLPITSKMMYSS